MKVSNVGLSMKNKDEQVQILIVGLGFVGLACFVGFNKLGYDVIGVDNNSEKIKNLRNLNFEEIEEDIGDYIKENSDILDKISNNLESSLFKNNKLISIFCVGTPNYEDGTPNLEILKNSISDLLSKDFVKKHEIVIKSTVPPGTIEKVLKPYIDKNFSNIRYSLISNPEFLREGTELMDFVDPDRIVIGQYNKSSIDKIYSDNYNCIFRTSPSGAEFCKYYSNSSLSAMISFTNEMRLYAEKLKIKDIKNIFNQFHNDRRWNDSSMKNYFWPGIGFGGYCLPKDTRALLDNMRENNFPSKVLRSVIEVNDELIERFSDVILEKFKDFKNVVFFGSSFKVGSDDIRESKTIEIYDNIKNNAKFNILFLNDKASRQIKKYKTEIKLIDQKDINKDSGIVIFLKNNEYISYLSNHERNYILDIPLLLDL